MGARSRDIANSRHKRPAATRHNPLFDTVEPRLLLSTFAVINTADSGTGSLRQAIVDSNGSLGLNLIRFDIPGSGPHVIRPASALPKVTNNVIIDGYTQPGSIPNTAIQGDNASPTVVLDGSGIVDRTRRTGLQVKADNSTIRGLVIENFDAVGALFVGTNDHLEGSFVGVDATGKVAAGNGLGVAVLGGGGVIGGTSPATRNVISGNTAGIGLANLTVGGASPLSPAAGGVIENNLIGTDVTGTGDLGNATVGVGIVGSNNVVGGTGPGQANTIAFNGKVGAALNLGAGVVVAGLVPSTATPPALVSTGNLISGNSIFSNDNVGIAQVSLPTSSLLPLLNLSSANLTSVVSNVLAQVNPNAGDNVHLPSLTSAISSHGVTTVRGTFAGTPNTTYHIQFFSGATLDPSGHGEGRTFLGESVVKTAADGTSPIVFTAPSTVVVGQNLAATSIDPANNTSGFSTIVTVAPAPAPTLAAIADQTIVAGGTVKLVATGADLDPSQSLTYSASAGTIDPKTGVFSYTALPGTGSRAVTITVSDQSSPAQTASKTFNIVVLQPVQVTAPIGLTISKRAITSLSVHFGASVTGAGDSGNYHLALVSTKRLKRHLVTVIKAVAIKGVTYDDASHTATIVPARKLAPGKVNQLTITASGIHDASGQALDGNHDGLAGGDLVARIGRNSVTIL